MGAELSLYRGAQELILQAMNRRVLGFSLVFAVLACSAALWADPPARVGRLNLINGSVSFRSASNEDWATASLNYPLITGDQLWTDAGARAELHLGSTAVRLAPKTDFSILLLDDQTTQLSLSQGALNIRLRDLDSDESFEIATPQASISLLEPGSYRIDVRENGATSVVARSGDAELDSGTSAVTVSPDQFVAIGEADSEAFELRVAPAPDAWEQWCMQRDQREDRFASSRYVPPTMVGYEDLDEYGSWQVIADYGICWIPRGVPAGWAPYHFGRWVWVAPWGWTWIDDAPWGFAPFHYGRWAFVQGFWCWLPGTFVARPVYAPALVVFVGGSGWGPGVGWFPLGPREVYVPPYQATNAYFHNINIAYVTNVDVTRVDLRHYPYVNRSVSGAVTVMNPQSFVRAEPANRAAVQVRPADINAAPVIGMGPSLTPGRESTMGRPGGAAQAAPRPPAAAQGRTFVVRRAPPPEQVPAASAEQRQPAIQDRPKYRVIGTPAFQGGRPPQAPGAEQGGRTEPGRGAGQPQVVPSGRQDREGPMMAPDSSRQRGKQPSKPQSSKKRVRKLINGQWVWVEEDEQ
jgi:hypothetical protein